MEVSARKQIVRNHASSNSVVAAEEMEAGAAPKSKITIGCWCFCGDCCEDCAVEDDELVMEWSVRLLSAPTVKGVSNERGSLEAGEELRPGGRGGREAGRGAGAAGACGDACADETAGGGADGRMKEEQERTKQKEEERKKMAWKE